MKIIKFILDFVYTLSSFIGLCALGIKDSVVGKNSNVDIMLYVVLCCCVLNSFFSLSYLYQKEECRIAEVNKKD